MIAGILTGLLIHFQTGDLEGTVCRRHVHTDGYFPAPDKNDHCSAGFFNTGDGHCKNGRYRAVGRIGGKTLAWFLGASLISLMLGLVIMNIVNLGAQSAFAGSGYCCIRQNQHRFAFT